VRGKRNKVYVARYYEDAIRGDGSLVRRRRSITLGSVAEIGSRRAARARLDELLRPLNQGWTKPKAMLTFEDFVREHWKPKALGLFKLSTRLSYQSVLNYHLRPFFGKRVLSEIRAPQIQEFLVLKAGQGLSWYAVRNVRNVLGRIFRTAVDWAYLDESPVSKVRLPSKPISAQRDMLTPDQFRQLLEKLDEPCRSMVVVAALTGLRRGEVFGLRWRDVDLERGFLDVTQAVYEGHIGTPKTASSRRRIPLSGPAVEVFRSLRLGDPEFDLVFHSRRGTPVRPANMLNRFIHPACEEAGVPKVGWHSLRHLHATLLSDLGESLKTAQAILGHSDLETTLAVYTHSVPDSERRAEERLARRLMDPNGPKSGLGSDRDLKEVV